MTVEDAVEDGARNKDGGEQVCQQAEGEGDGETFDRTGPEQEQDGCRHNRGHVGVDNRQPSVAKALLHGRGRILPGAQLLADALEDEHVGVYAHADGEDKAGDPGQSQRGPGEAKEAEQDDQVQDQREIGRASCRERV